MLTSKQRAILRGKANTMDPVFIVGKGEIDETMIQGVKDCLDARELIKLKVLESSMYNAREASVKLAEATAKGICEFLGVAWQAEPGEDNAEDTPDSWAAEAWGKAKDKGVLDGTRPRDNMTRQELAVVLDRLNLI